MGAEDANCAAGAWEGLAFLYGPGDMGNDLGQEDG